MVLLSLLGCVPLPWVTPPMSIDGAVALTSSPPPDPEFVPVAGSVAIALRPLGVFPTLKERRFDPAAGALYEWQYGHRTLGGFGELDWRTWQRPWRGFRASAGPFVAVDLVVRDPYVDQPVIPGVRVGMRGQLLGWADFRKAESNVYGGGAGAGWGEWGFGGIADLGLRLAPEGPEWSFALGVSVELPASAGVVLVPIY